MKAAKKVNASTGIAACAAVAAVGIDFGDRWSHWCTLSANGEVVGRGGVRTAAEAILELAAGGVGFRWRLKTEPIYAYDRDMDD
jgi:hypothetical protein